MNLQEWLNNRWLRPQASSIQEIRELLSIVDRDLEDAARPGLSSDWRFGIAYNAAFKLCTIALCASGYRAEREAHHYRTIAALPLVLGEQGRAHSDYLDRCRRKRNVVQYDRAGAASESEADELMAFTRELRAEVLAWLRANHPNLLPSG